MLENGWEWVAVIGLLLLLLGYVAYQKYCWLCDDEDQGGEGNHGR